MASLPPPGCSFSRFLPSWLIDASHIPQGVALNERFAELVRVSPEFELVTTPILALSVFRIKPPASASPEHAEAAANELNRALAARLSAESEKILITPPVINGMACLRFAVGAQRTEKEHVDWAWDLIQKSAREVWRAGKEQVVQCSV